MEKYPYWRVLIGFPFLTQLLVALLLFIFFTDLSRQQINDIHIIFFINVYAAILATVPTFLLAMVCCWADFRCDTPKVWQKMAAIMFGIVFVYALILVGLRGTTILHPMPVSAAMFCGMVAAIYAAVVLRWILPTSHIAVR
ncbi:hypothetical protein [Alysiella filiformis]|uniref:Uncharacterized protein n=1 Tax=Alysiella filiformis DSM 16848 TaxID=1120981 RepID=A0A286E1S6_9NEIS|nr:hypothetical protein [Alysiella filiformis]QMT30787.1 hypothetical protein H3L97_08555 [Alysiella filiformis]UBQ56231.1 hypothetical protein JF568_00130 [Alysiella filiformis DSM 16848]SOD64843.1 hypothetical protein SAMN02746062_00062 [Alysiella filiformis DSM 16848]